MAGLTDVERDMIAFERENTWWEFEGVREAAILERFGLSTTVYAKRLLVLIERDEAQRLDPLTVNRLRDRAAHAWRKRLQDES